jgi:hypothetical protein
MATNRHRLDAIGQRELRYSQKEKLLACVLSKARLKASSVRLKGKMAEDMPTADEYPRRPIRRNPRDETGHHPLSGEHLIEVKELIPGDYKSTKIPHH